MKNSSNIIKIRAHHLLCMQGFQGYGYSQNFVDNMAEVIKKIYSYADLEIKIIDECDIICSHCPNNQSGICQKEKNSKQKVKDMDRGVLKKLELKAGTMGKAMDIFSLVKTKFSNNVDIQDICGNCDWKEKCFFEMQIID